MTSLVEKLRSAQSVVLTTHKHGDGDGLGAQLALFHALRKMGKKARILNLDKPPRKYDFLGTSEWIEAIAPNSSALGRADLALVFDTNDARLVEPLFSLLKPVVSEILFIDHHPVLKHGPAPTPGSWIDTSAASTGELTFRLIQALNIDLDAAIARALYTSIVFDTQMFRYVKGAPQSHLIAAELLRYEQHPDEIHRCLFANYTAEKMAYLARALARVEYTSNHRIAFVHLKSSEIHDSGLDLDESGDVIDMMMNIETVEAAALLREDGPGTFKLSLRSKGALCVLPIAEAFGGGGHESAAGAYLKGELSDLRGRLLNQLEALVNPISANHPTDSIARKK